MIAIILRKWTLKELVCSIFFVLYCFFMWYKTSLSSILYFAIGLLLFKNVKFNNIAKIDLVCKLIFMFSIFLLYSMGSVENYDTIMSNGRIRYSFGYYNTNNFFFYIFVFSFDVLYLLKNKLRLWHIILLGIFGFFMGYLTYCRTGIVLYFLNLFGLYIMSKKNFLRSKFIKKVLIYLIIFCFILSIMSLIYYNNNLFMYKELDALFSGRIRFGQEFVEKYGISILGQHINTVTGLQSSITGERALNLDNFYFFSLISYGIFFSIFIIFLVIKTQKKLLDNNLYFLAFFIAILCLYSINEKVLLSFETNIWICVFGCAVSNFGSKINN